MTGTGVNSQPQWRRPKRGEVISIVVLVALALLPIWPFAVGMWAWGLFAALYFWPSMAIMVHVCLKSRSWPRIVGGPSISWAGKTYSTSSGIKSRY